MSVTSINHQQYTASQFQGLFPRLFANCQQTDVGILLGVFKPIDDLQPGEVLIRQGEVSNTLYLVCAGLLSVALENNARRFNLGMIGRGQWVGDVSLIEPGPASATVSVLEKATVLRMSSQDLNELRLTHPRTASRLLNALSVVLANRLRISSNMAILMGQKSNGGFPAKDSNGSVGNWIANLGRWLNGMGGEDRERFAREELQLQKTELEQKYKHIYLQEKESLLGEERDRILAELHDGVGGQLVAMLAMLENRTVQPAELKDCARAALDDLRLMIDSLDSIDGDIAVVLGMFRSRIEPRLAAQNIRFDWQVTDLPLLPELTPREVLQILRILQESVTNIIKHANATVITVKTRQLSTDNGSTMISIEVKDNGEGFTHGKSRAGHGLETMRRRASSVGAGLSIDAGENGTAVILNIPVST